MDSTRFARSLKKSTIGWAVNADARNCSILIDQSVLIKDGLAGLPFRSGDWNVKQIYILNVI